MRFEKVSLKAFADDMYKYHYGQGATMIYSAWDGIKLPTRSTEYSAGYDIRIPIDVTIPAGERRVIPTGIRAVFDENEKGSWHLQLYVRSSVGIKQGIVLTNGTGIIDPDYMDAKNEGDFLLALMNTSDLPVKFKAGDRVCQGVFTLHGLTTDDKAKGRRTGGVGSTG